MAVAEDQFTLHRRAWSGYRRLPWLLQVWIVVALILGLIELKAQLSGPSDEDRIRDAITLAVREGTGPDPGGSCSALSPTGLTNVVKALGNALAPTPGAAPPITSGDPLAACRSLVARLRAEATAADVSNFARGSVRAVVFQNDGSAAAYFVAADHRLGAKLTMRKLEGHWLIDAIGAG